MSNEMIPRRGLMLILSSPSGAGKTTLSRKLLESDKNISLSVSATTRPMRPGEVHGKDYYFLSPEEFEKWQFQGRFLEHASVFGQLYGTPEALVTGALSAGQDVLFDIDWQGTKQLKAKMPHDVASIFILPPSHDELERRLRNRAQDTAEVVAARMAKAVDEMSHWDEYEYIIVNHDVGKALGEIQSILDAERLKRDRQTGIPEFVGKLV
ncbi:MAG TPA: guanylate kinase [Rhizomicrobium sp.]|jgi:guanylate kinase